MIHPRYIAAVDTCLRHAGERDESKTVHEQMREAIEAELARRIRKGMTIREGDAASAVHMRLMTKMHEAEWPQT